MKRKLLAVMMAVCMTASFAGGTATVFAAQEEIMCAEQYDYILVNDEMEKTVRRLGQIIHGKRYSRNSMKAFMESYLESEIHSDLVDVIRSL